MHAVVGFLRDCFLPSSRNGMTPFIFSRTASAIFFIIGILIAGAPLLQTQAPFATLLEVAPFESVKGIALVNQSRSQAGLPPLIGNQMLSKAAEDKARDMLTRQYFSHTTPDGKAPWVFLEKNNYHFIAAGENLAIDYRNPREAEEAFMQSPAHRANTLNPRYKEIGIAALRGIFEGHSSLVLVQFFGTPASPDTLVTRRPVPTVLGTAPNNETGQPGKKTTPHATAANQNQTFPLSESNSFRIAACLILLALGLSLFFTMLQQVPLQISALARIFILVLFFSGLLAVRPLHEYAPRIDPAPAAIFLSQ